MSENFFFNHYTKKGFVISEPILDENNIENIRNLLDQEFNRNDENEKAGKLISQFKNVELIKKTIAIFNSNQIKKITKELEKITSKKVSLLPNFQVLKNYHVNLKEFHGWHRDCGGELKYDYCKNILANKDYLFSKVGVSLQNNTEYGGSIDLIKNSQKYFSNFKVLLRKIKNIPLRFTMFFHKYFNNLYYLIPENFFMFFLNAKKLEPKKSSAVFFDSRIIHRGSPIAKEKIDEVKYSEGEFKAILPIKKDKYTFYSHFGSVDAVDSYMYDRLKRDGNGDELKSWLEQIKTISNYDQELSNDMSQLLEPIIIKYKDHL